VLGRWKNEDFYFGGYRRDGRGGPGEQAVFEGPPANDPGLQITAENWVGPGGQWGSGARFQVRNDKLSAGKYDVTLTIIDSQKRSISATATLEVTPAYKISLEATPLVAEMKAPVKFTVSITPNSFLNSVTDRQVTGQEISRFDIPIPHPASIKPQSAPGLKH
jgi:hypothetical protein